MSVCLVCISHMAGVHHTILHTAVYISSSCLIEKPWIIAPHLQHSWILILRMPPVHMALWPVQHMSTAKVRSSRRGNACVVPSQHTITILTYQLHIPYDNTTSLANCRSDLYSITTIHRSRRLSTNGRNMKIDELQFAYLHQRIFCHDNGAYKKHAKTLRWDNSIARSRARHSNRTE